MDYATQKTIKKTVVNLRQKMDAVDRFKTLISELNIQPIIERELHFPLLNSSLSQHGWHNC